MSWFRRQNDDPEKSMPAFEFNLTTNPPSPTDPPDPSAAARQRKTSANATPPSPAEVSAALDAFIEAPDWDLTRQVLEQQQRVLLTLEACLALIRRVGHSSSAHNRGILSTCARILLIAYDRDIPTAWEWLEDRRRARAALNAAMKAVANLPPEQAAEEFQRSVERLPSAQRQHANDILAEAANEAREAEENEGNARPAGDAQVPPRVDVADQMTLRQTPMHPVTPQAPSGIPAPTDRQRQLAEMLLAQTLGQLDEALRRGLLVWLGKPGVSATPQEITAAYTVFLAATATNN